MKIDYLTMISTSSMVKHENLRSMTRDDWNLHDAEWFQRQGDRVLARQQRTLYRAGAAALVIVGLLYFVTHFLRV